MEIDIIIRLPYRLEYRNYLENLVLTFKVEILPTGLGSTMF